MKIYKYRNNEIMIHFLYIYKERGVYIRGYKYISIYIFIILYIYIYTPLYYRCMYQYIIISVFTRKGRKGRIYCTIQAEILAHQYLIIISISPLSLSMCAADAISSGVSRADSRAAAQSSTVVYCCFVVVSRAILWIYNHSQCRIRYIM